jgi:hypothetical protein
LGAAGAANKPFTQTRPGIEEALERLVEGGARGDRQSPLRWTSKSAAKLALDAAVRRHVSAHAIDAVVSPGPRRARRKASVSLRMGLRIRLSHRQPGFGGDQEQYGRRERRGRSADAHSGAVKRTIARASGPECSVPSALPAWTFLIAQGR